MSCLNLTCHGFGRSSWYDKLARNYFCQPEICFCVRYCVGPERQCAMKCWGSVFFSRQPGGFLSVG